MGRAQAPQTSVFILAEADVYALRFAVERKIVRRFDRSRQCPLFTAGRRIARV